MNGLIRSEILRFRSRSLVAVVIVGGLLLIGVGSATALIFSRPPEPREVQIAQYQLSRCPQEARIANESNDAFIANGNYYGAQEFVDYRCFDPVRSLAFAPTDSLPLVVLPVILGGAAVIFVCIAVCFGASLVGADWHHRSMTTLLTWESRRGRVYAARMGTVACGTFLVVFGLEIACGVALAFVTWWRGTLFGVDALWVRTTLEIGFRIALVCAIVATITAALAMMSRSTGAAFGLLIAYFGYEQLLQATNPTKNFWVLGRSFVAFLIADEDLASGLLLDFRAAVAAMALYTGAIVIAAFLVFSTRDVS